MAARDTLPGLFNLLFKFVWVLLMFSIGIWYVYDFGFTFLTQSSYDETPLTIFNFGLPYFTAVIFVGWFSKDVLLGIRFISKKAQVISFLILISGTIYHTFFLRDQYAYWFSSDIHSLNWFFGALPIISSLGLLINRIIRWWKS